MAFTVERILSDARRLSSRLKEQDVIADSVMIRTQVLQKQIEAMKQFQENLNELNDIAKHRPRNNLILGLAEENSRIRDLKAENKELRQSLEEHQSALELIMTKYREQVNKLAHVSRMNLSLDRKVNDRSQEIDEARLEKIAEMAAVMQKALELDVKNSHSEVIARLKEENESMRRMLHVSSDLMLEQTSSESKVTQTDLDEMGLGDSTIRQRTLTLAEEESLCSSSTDSLVTVFEHSPNNTLKT